MWPKKGGTDVELSKIYMGGGEFRAFQIERVRHTQQESLHHLSRAHRGAHRIERNQLENGANCISISRVLREEATERRSKRDSLPTS